MSCQSVLPDPPTPTTAISRPKVGCFLVPVVVVGGLLRVAADNEVESLIKETIGSNSVSDQRGQAGLPQHACTGQIHATTTTIIIPTLNMVDPPSLQVSSDKLLDDPVDIRAARRPDFRLDQPHERGFGARARVRVDGYILVFASAQLAARGCVR